MNEKERPVRKIDEIADLFISGPADRSTDDQRCEVMVAPTSKEASADSGSNPSRPCHNPSPRLMLLNGTEISGVGRALALSLAIAKSSGRSLLLNVGPGVENTRYLSGLRSLCEPDRMHDDQIPRGICIADAAVEVLSVKSIWSLQTPPYCDWFSSSVASAQNVLIDVETTSCEEVVRLARFSDRILAFSSPSAEDMLRVYRLIKLAFMAESRLEAELVVTNAEADLAKAVYGELGEIVGTFLQQPLGFAGELPLDVDLTDLTTALSSGREPQEDWYAPFCSLAEKVTAPLGTHCVRRQRLSPADLWR